MSYQSEIEHLVLRSNNRLTLWLQYRYLTSITWRWVFIINIPLSAIGIVVLHFVTRKLLLGPQDIQDDTKDSDEQISHSATLLKRLSTIDYGGQLFFLFGIGLLVLALTWAGSYYSWTDSKVLGPLVSGAVLTIAFVAWEYLLLPGRPLTRCLPFQRAMLPMNIIWSRNGGILTYINFITGMAMYAVFYFVALYFTLGRGFDSGKAGISLVYYLPGLGGKSYSHRLENGSNKIQLAPISPSSTPPSGRAKPGTHSPSEPSSRPSASSSLPSLSKLDTFPQSTACSPSQA